MKVFRVLTRIYLAPDDLDKAVAFYERLFRQTQATFLVDSIEDFKSWLLGTGAVILEEPKKVPTGRNMRVRHPDGTIIEYVEHTRR